MLHPVRMRIIQAFLGGLPGRQLTVQQLADELTDVPTATLYRHLNKLASADILQVVGEHQIRGAVEKVYGLATTGATIAPTDITSISREDHLRHFTTFVSGLLGDFSRYLARDQVDLIGDGVGYRQIALYLSDDELQGMIEGLSAVIKPLLTS